MNDKRKTRGSSEHIDKDKWIPFHTINPKRIVGNNFGLQYHNTVGWSGFESGKEY